VSDLKKSAGDFVTSRSLFAWLGSLCYRYRRTVIAIWGILVLLGLALTPYLDSVLKGAGMVYEGGESHRVEQLLQQQLKIAPDPLTIVFQNTQNPENQRQVEQILTQIKNLPLVSSVVSAAERPDYRTADGNTQYSIINLKVTGLETVPVIENIEQVLSQNNTKNLNTFLTGKFVVERDAQSISKVDLAKAELFALPLTLVALLFVFGSVVAATMPVAMGIMSVSVTFGLLCLVSLKMDLSVFVLNITSMLGLGLGIDYSLLIVNRFREELETNSVENAIVRTIDTAGRAVFFSGLTVCIGLVSLLLFPILLLSSLGVAGSLVVLLSVAAALTLLPALLGIVGHNINRWRLVPTTPQHSGIWSAIAKNVIRYSVAAVALVLAIVIILTSPFFQARFGVGDASILPKGVKAREGVEVLSKAFGHGEVSPLLLAISTKNSGDRIFSEQNIATLYNLVAKLKADSRVAKVSSLVNIDPRLRLQDYQQLYSVTKAPTTEVAAIQTKSACADYDTKSLPQEGLVCVPALLLDKSLRATIDYFKKSDSTTLIVINSRTPSNDEKSQNLVQDLRALSLDNLQVQVGGQTASALDTIQEVYRRFPLVLAVIMSVTFVVLCLLFNSVILPLKAIIINLLSLGASFGAMVFIFQEGNFHTWLNFAPLGYLDILLPVVLFCVLFGLSMDYEVFLLTRIQEAYERSGNNTLSVIEGLERTGRIITSAALLMIIVTSAFALTSIIFVKALGLGTALAVFLDTTLIRAILVPATMHLMGKWNWWSPKFLYLDKIKVKLD
jgi:RND superfamily putative drug exporter